MGWFGYGLYDGDDTQTRHIDFIKWAIPTLSDDDVFEYLEGKRTIIPKNLLPSFKKGIPSILKKMKTPKYWDEYAAIDWQMLLSLFVDNNLKVPRIILINGMLASDYLLGEHAEDFNNPSMRKKCIKYFMNKVLTNFTTQTTKKALLKLLK